MEVSVFTVQGSILAFMCKELISKTVSACWHVSDYWLW